jgi:hypothetical protein
MSLETGTGAIAPNLRRPGSFVDTFPLPCIRDISRRHWAVGVVRFTHPCRGRRVLRLDQRLSRARLSTPRPAGTPPVWRRNGAPATRTRSVGSGGTASAAGSVEEEQKTNGDGRGVVEAGGHHAACRQQRGDRDRGQQRHDVWVDPQPRPDRGTSAPSPSDDGQSNQARAVSRVSWRRLMLRSSSAMEAATPTSLALTSGSLPSLARSSSSALSIAVCAANRHGVL